MMRKRKQKERRGTVTTNEKEFKVDMLADIK